MKKIILLFLIISLFSCNKKSENFIYEDIITGVENNEFDNISIISFNIQVFGRSKSKKKEVMDVIIDIIDDYDIIAIQEIRDRTDFTLNNLIKSMPPEYKLVASQRDGRSNSKEQAIYIYNDNILDLTNVYDDSDINDDFERAPFSAFFETDDDSLEFQMVNVHISPKDAKHEIQALSIKIYEYINSYRKDIILVGDFNADGHYFNEEDLINYFPKKDFSIIISNDMDTTVAESDNTYDRIIITSGLNDNVENFGVLYYENYLPPNILENEISDHFPVYLILAEWFMELKWRKAYETGIQEIDKQHKHLFSLFQDLYNTPMYEKGNKLKESIQEFFNYAEYHFASEEKYWKKINLPQDMIEHHRKEHNYYIQEIQSKLNQDHHNGIFLTMDILDFLKDWVIDHILGEDMEYVIWVKEQNNDI